jgi:hypothetical protein
MAFTPTPCAGCGGGAGGGFDVEQNLLCDTLADGTVVGTALAIWTYDDAGNPVGAPTFVHPVTGVAYVAQGTLMPCPGETGCLEPVQFCFTSTAVGDVDHPGRQYDLTLPINPGFAVQSMNVDAVNHAANLVWNVDDPDGEGFRADLTTFIETRIPSDAVVTITNPNAGTAQVCGTALPMTIHIECIRLDEDPPNLIELIYNGGQDLIQNPAYNESPALNPPVSQGNYGFRLLSRQDDPGPFPGNPPANDALCTNVANRGWETNDVGRTFEIWGQDQVNASNVTPTPRGTPVQEITSDGPPPGGISTIWQTFQAPASGNFVIRVVHGARDAGETHRITLDNGDTNAAQNGDLIDNITTPGVVTNSPGGPGPWTTFTQTIPLTAGNIYTLAISETDGSPDARGGLFTDMRAYIDLPDLRATATTDDDTCVVTTQETTSTTTCELWSPLCENGDITAWKNAEDGQVLTNASFWGQTPSPECCTSPAASGGTGSVSAGNLVHSYAICGVVGGVAQSLVRVVYTDQAGGVLASTIIGPDGGPVTPASWIPGDCGDTARIPLGPVCYQSGGPVTNQGFMTVDADNNPVLFNLSGGIVPSGYTIVICPDTQISDEILCDAGNANHQFLRVYVNSPVSSGNSVLWNLELDGTTLYVPVGPVGICSAGDTRDSELQLLCDATPTRFLRKYLYDGETGAFVGVVNTTLDGTTPFAPVGAVGICTTPTATDFDFVVLELCDNNGGFLRRLTFNSSTGVVTSTVNTTLAGVNYVPVGTVGICDGCCPTVVGEGCSNTGSGKYVAIRSTAGVVSLFDAVTGAAIVAGNVIACTTTLNAQARMLAASTSWTPGGDVTGVLTSVSATVVTGTATVTDSNGTVVSGIPVGATLEWTVEDANTLTGPQSIAADAASSVLVTWTQR